MTDKFFLYDPAGDGFQVFSTAEQRDAAAKVAIDVCLVDGYWSEDVLSIVVGEITGVAMKTNIQYRPDKLDENSEDEDGKRWNLDMEEKHDVKIRPIAEMGLAEER